MLSFTILLSLSLLVSITSIEILDDSSLYEPKELDEMFRGGIFSYFLQDDDYLDDDELNIHDPTDDILKELDNIKLNIRKRL